MQDLNSMLHRFSIKTPFREELLRRKTFCISNIKPDKFATLKLVRKIKIRGATRSKSRHVE